jgi:import inner membrane translocase subunit TIM22
MSYFIGGAMGCVMAMFMSAVEMREIEIGKIRRSTRIVLRKDWRKIMNSGKAFASFGGFFLLF